MGSRHRAGSLVVLWAVMLALAFPLSTPRAQEDLSGTTAAIGGGECLAWDISGEWQYEANSGAHGQDYFQQDAAGNLTGHYYNEGTGFSGSYVDGKVTGASVYFKTEYNEVFRGSVHSDGTTMSGTFASGNLNGTWQDTGLARCIREAPPPAAGSMEVTVKWGPYIARTSHGTAAAAAATAAGQPPVQSAGPALPGAIQQGAMSANAFVIYSSPYTVVIDVGALLSGWRLFPLHLFVYEDVWVAEEWLPPYKGRFEIGWLNPTPPSGDPQWYGNQRILVTPFYGAFSAAEEHRISIRDPADNYVGILTVWFQKFSGWSDPSGHVYNHSSNQRLEGATASCYVKKAGQWVLWDAAAHDQTNPQATNPDGLYGWYVPEGDYQVRVSNACYADAQSASLHHPPSHNDVNLGLVPAACAAVTVEDVWLANVEARPEQTFCAGAHLEQHIRLANSSQQDVSVQLAWTVTDPEGKPVAPLSGSGSYLVPPFGTHVPLPGVLPKNAAAGAYTLSAAITQQGQTSLRVAPFYVHHCTAHLPLVLRDVGHGPAAQWVTIKQQEFEGAFPGDWELSSNPSSPQKYTWAKRTCRPYAGSYSGWPVGGGANGAALSCGANYPNDAESWMVYGPFSLAGATAAELKYKLWLYSESGPDVLARLASTDGTNYSGYVTSGNTHGWVDKTLDLANVPTLGNLLGQPQVWVALVFQSNGSQSYAEGAYVDSILLRKYVSVAGDAPAQASPAAAVGPQETETEWSAVRQSAAGR